jgi:hypothetical protein
MIKSTVSKAATLILGFFALTLLTSGCSSVDEALGNTKSAPDEFEVVVRPPLTLPPNFSLRPATDPANAETDSAALTAPVSGTDAVSVSDQSLTQAARADGSAFDALFGTGDRLENIRELVDEETYGIQIERRLPLEVIFGGQPNVGPNLDAAAEALRIRKALEEGAGITATPTPAIDPVEGSSITVE